MNVNDRSGFDMPLKVVSLSRYLSFESFIEPLLAAVG